MDDKIKEIAEKIKTLEIQGASNIALAAIDAFFKYALVIKDKDKVKWAYDTLRKTRPNEPLMQNLLKNMYYNCRRRADLKKAYYFARSYIINSRERIAVIGHNIIEDGEKIGTICHSSIVERTLIFAKKVGKEFEVWISETRPRYQGRITAKKLSRNGIKVKFLVDGSIWRIVKEVDKVFIGADVLLQTGVINKVGTRILTRLASFEDKPVYVLAPLLKYREEFERGIPERIEMRDPGEIWKINDDNIEILNYAFDFIPKKYISAIVSEVGIYSYEMIKYIIEKHYSWLFK